MDQGGNKAETEEKPRRLPLQFQGVEGQGWPVFLPEVTREGSLDYRGLGQRGENG